MSDPTITPEAAAVIAGLSVVGPVFGSRLAARTAARAGGYRTYSYGKRRHVAVSAEGRLFYLGGAEDAAVWQPMTEVTAVSHDDAPAAEGEPTA